METVPQPGRHRVIWAVRGKEGPILAMGAGTWGTERDRDTPDRGIKRKDRDKKTKTETDTEKEDKRFRDKLQAAVVAEDKEGMGAGRGDAPLCQGPRPSDPAWRLCDLIGGCLSFCREAAPCQGTLTHLEPARASAAGLLRWLPRHEQALGWWVVVFWTRREAASGQDRVLASPGDQQNRKGSS